MGWDNYLSWDNMTKEEKDARITGFRTDGPVGYLRASYGWPEGQDFYTYVLLGEKQGHFEKQAFDPYAAHERWEKIKDEFIAQDEYNEKTAEEVFKFIQLGKTKQKARLNPMVEGH